MRGFFCFFCACVSACILACCASIRVSVCVYGVRVGWGGTGREGMIGAVVICGGTRVKQAWKVERENLLFSVITS